LTAQELDSNFIKIYNDLSVLFQQSQPFTTQGEGAVIHFSSKINYNTPATPSNGNITHNLTDAQLGIQQRIYHDSSVVPSFPVSWKLISGNYVTDSLNIIFAEWVGGDTVEYEIKQYKVL
jgi:hypothetical protein